MYLSQIKINSLDSQAKNDLANPYQMHRTIMRAFPNPLPANERVLFRVETFHEQIYPLVLVQSQSIPDWGQVEEAFENYFIQSPQVKSLDGLKINQGDILRFRLRANPSKRILYGEQKNSQRISLFSEKDRLGWLTRKAEKGGFNLIEDRLLIRDAPYRTIFISGDVKTSKATINMVDYDGLLKIEYPELLLNCMEKGIGPAKGLGCGLLSLALA